MLFVALAQLTPWTEIFQTRNTGMRYHFLSPGDLPNSGIECASPARVPCIAARFFIPGPPGESSKELIQCKCCA